MVSCQPRSSFFDQLVQLLDWPERAADKFELMINRKTDKALGITVLQSLLLCTDEVIE